MAQYLRPDATLSAGTFTGSIPGVDIHTLINEATPDDGQYCRNNPGTALTASCSFGLSNATDPQQHTGHIIRIRGYADLGNTNVTVNLKEGGVTRASFIFAEFTTTSTTHTYTLTTLEAASISDYNNLSVEIIKEQTGEVVGTGGDTGFAGRIFITWLEFEIPTPGRAHLDYVNGALTVVPLASGHYLKILSGSIVRVAGIEVAGALILSGTQIVTWDGVS